jgi:hypothetical protein
MVIGVDRLVVAGETSVRRSRAGDRESSTISNPGEASQCP